MATSLMSQPCGEACNEEVEYKISFVVTSLEMSDAESQQMFSDVLVAITWDGNVVKLMTNQLNAEEFHEEMHLLVQGTPAQISEKLKKSPVMIDLSRLCTELGTIKLPLSDCFSDAVLCNDFNSQMVSHEFKFVKNDHENAKMNAYFRVQQLLDDGIAGNLRKELKSKLTQRDRNMRRAAAAAAGEDGCDSENDPCEDFVCPDEQAEHCKRNLGLDQNIYRIINGILINTKDKIGPCGEKCPVAAKYVKELCKESPITVPTMSSLEPNQNVSKCTQLFDNYCSCDPNICPVCNGVKPSINYSATRKPCQDDWIDRNIHEENLLNQLCEKYGINVDDVRDVGQQVDNKSDKKNSKKTNKKKTKCSKRAKKLSAPSMNDPCGPPEKKQETSENFIKKMKRKTRGKYCYDYGNNYPLRRVFTSSNIEKGAGDCANVPKYMGWRWDEPIPGIGDKKLYPGHINKTVRCIMKHCLNPFPYDTIPLTRRDKSGRIIKTCNDYSKHPEFNPALVQKPTLLIKKRDGEYCITMNPLKDKKKLETDCNPYLNCMPLKFKIKENPEEIKKHRVKKLLRAHGFNKKCSCLDLKCCRCMSENAKKLLAYEMKNVSKKMQLHPPLEFAEFDDSSDSELEMEFVTPSAIIDSRKFIPNVVHYSTQYDLKDFMPPSRAIVEEIKKPKCKKENACVKPKLKRRMESIYIDPPCPPVVNFCEPQCVMVQYPGCC